MSDCCTWPFTSEVEPGWNTILSLLTPITATSQLELINYNLPQGTQAVAIPYAVAKASSNIVTVGAMIYNTTDSVVLTGVTFTPTLFSTTSLTGLLSANLDSANYYYKTLILVAT